jgi:MOSC domain-containing protein YiiM
MTTQFQLRAVRIGWPQLLGQWKGKDVYSSIAKVPVAGATIQLDELGLAHNEQADLRVHGGVDKAVYVYPREHYEVWAQELGFDPPLGFFGENLQISGLLEGDVRIGDQWSWGNALLEVTKPRQPCYKLIMFTDVQDIIQRMRANHLTGWYLKVLKPAVVPTSGELVVVKRGGGETILANYTKKACGPLSPEFMG